MEKYLTSKKTNDMIVIRINMKQIFYTKTPDLTKNLQEIDELNKELLLLPLPHNKKLQLRWEAQVGNIYHVFNLSGMRVRRNHIVELLSPNRPNKLSNEDKLILRYKSLFDIIYYDWTNCPDRLTLDDIKKIILSFNNSKTSIDESVIDRNLTFLELSSEHPILQSAIAYMNILTQFSPPSHIYIATLVSQMILCKHGYDFRRFASISKLFLNDRETYHLIIQDTTRLNSLTNWLEYYCTSVSDELKNIITYARSLLEQKSDQNELYTLSDRHKKILSVLDDPSATISNKQVQELFNISQITASRDLANLNALGLVLPVGKGRSVRYTKA